MKKAIIIGGFGQDGILLTELLQEKEYEVISLGEDKSFRNAKSFPFVDITSETDVISLVKEEQPDEIYHFAAYHQSSEDIVENEIALLDKSFQINTRTLSLFLEAVYQYSPKTKIFYAASSHVFSPITNTKQTEETKFNPTNSYGVSKACGILLCRQYRQKGVFASAGILYNHESSLRTDNFLTMKIIKTALSISRGEKNELILGDLEAKIDMGYAPEYVDAMHRILQLEKGDDFIIATGQLHSVKDVVQIIFASLGLDWKLLVHQDKSILTKNSLPRCGDASKLTSATGWKPKISFKRMLELMLQEEKEKR